MEYKIRITVWWIQRFFFNWLSFFYMFIPVMNHTYDKVDYIFVPGDFVFITIFYFIMVIRTSHNKPIKYGYRTWGNGDTNQSHSYSKYKF